MSKGGKFAIACERLELDESGVTVHGIPMSHTPPNPGLVSNSMLQVTLTEAARAAIKFGEFDQSDVVYLGKRWTLVASVEGDAAIVTAQESHTPPHPG